jgi:hypothetical protein
VPRRAASVMGSDYRSLDASSDLTALNAAYVCAPERC